MDKRLVTQEENGQQSIFSIIKKQLTFNFTIMKSKFKMFAAFFLGTTMMFSCQKKDDLITQAPVEDTAIETRAFGDTPVVAIYVETNDTNPLNAGDYMLSNGKPFAGIVEFFAANIHKETVAGVIRPTLYLNDKMTNLFENGGAAKYVKPLQDKGIKVLLTVLGDWQDIGVANMNDTQTTQFAQILAYAVEKYGLDGIGFDDEYANYTSTNYTSYSQIITKLHALMPTDKVITVFDWGNTHTINAEALALIDYSYHGYFGLSFVASGLVDKTRWSPVSINLGSYTNASTLNSLAKRTKTQGYGAFMFFNLRRSNDINPLNMFDATADGLYELSVTCENGNRPQDWTFVPSGYTITIDDVQ